MKIQRMGIARFVKRSLLPIQMPRTGVAAPGPAPMNEIRPVTIALLFRLGVAALPLSTSKAHRPHRTLRQAVAPAHPACPGARRRPSGRELRTRRSRRAGLRAHRRERPSLAAAPPRRGAAGRRPSTHRPSPGPSRCPRRPGRGSGSGRPRRRSCGSAGR